MPYFTDLLRHVILLLCVLHLKIRIRGTDRKDLEDLNLLYRLF